MIGSFFFSYIWVYEIDGSPEDVIKRFEQRSHAVDSRGVAEYLRALILTNGIADYLPDEQSGRSASLPALVIFFLKSLFYGTLLFSALCLSLVSWRIFKLELHKISPTPCYLETSSEIQIPLFMLHCLYHCMETNIQIHLLYHTIYTPIYMITSMFLEYSQMYCTIWDSHLN